MLCPRQLTHIFQIRNFCPCLRGLSKFNQAVCSFHIAECCWYKNDRTWPNIKQIAEQQPTLTTGNYGQGYFISLCPHQLTLAPSLQIWSTFYQMLLFLYLLTALSSLIEQGCILIDSGFFLWSDSCIPIVALLCKLADDRTENERIWKT